MRIGADSTCPLLLCCSSEVWLLMGPPGQLVLCLHMCIDYLGTSIEQPHRMTGSQT